ncbi:MAG: hypothetical protein ABFC42_10230 [Sulfuricella sp.]
MSHQHTPEPFGYFKAEPLGWTDCAETDEGAWPLYDQQAIDDLTKQRDELAAALEKFIDSHEECTDFDGFTAQIVSMDDYHEAQEVLDSVKGGA